MTVFGRLLVPLPLLLRLGGIKDARALDDLVKAETLRKILKMNAIKACMEERLSRMERRTIRTDCLGQ